jgi:hypothetical protein
MDSEREPIWQDYRRRSTTDKQKLAKWLETHWGTARMAAKHCPDLVDRKVKNVAALLEELVLERRTRATELPPRPNRMGQYTQFTGKHTDEGNDWGEIKKDKK